MHPLLLVRTLKPRSQRAKRDPGRWVVPIIAASLIVLLLLRVWP